MKEERQRYTWTNRNRQSDRGTGMKEERQSYTRTKRTYRATEGQE
jgi:hypothetical protein